MVDVATSRLLTKAFVVVELSKVEDVAVRLLTVTSPVRETIPPNIVEPLNTAFLRVAFSRYKLVEVP